MGFSFHTADPKKDREIILKLWKDNLQFADVDKRYDWLYFENPAGPMQTILARHEETGEIVGAGSLYPQRVSLFGEVVLFGVCADYMVDKRFRVFGPALQIQRKLIEFLTDSTFDFLLGFPNKAAQGVIKHIGYELIGSEHRYVRVLKTRDKVAEKIKPFFLARMTAFFVDQVLFLDNFIKVLYFRSKYQGNHLEDFQGDDFVARSLESINHLVVCHKPQDQVRWRYQDKKHKIFSISLKADSSVKGLIIYSRIDSGILIEDIVASDEKIINALLTLFVDAAYKTDSKYITIQFMGDHSFLDTIKQSRFFLRGEQRNCYLFCKDEYSAENRQKVLKEDNWFFFESDMDI